MVLPNKKLLILEAFKSDQAARLWFNQPIEILGGLTPFEILSKENVNSKEIDYLYTCFESGVFFLPLNREEISLTNQQLKMLEST